MGRPRVTSTSRQILNWLRLNWETFARILQVTLRGREYDMFLHVTFPFVGELFLRHETSSQYYG